MSDRRILGAIRILDASNGALVRRSLRIKTDPNRADLIQNLSGLWVVRSLPSLSAYTDGFQRPLEPPAPDAPAFESQPLTLTITDPLGEYLPRLAVCLFPRQSDLPAEGQSFPPNWVPGPLFRPLDVRLYRAAAATTGSNWAVVRASVANASTRAALPHAWIRVLRNGNAIAFGLADDRGEALVAVPGLSRISWPEEEAGDTVLVSEVEATLEVVWNRNQGGSLPNPDVLEAQRAGFVRQSFPIRLAVGRVERAPLLVTVPNNP